MRFFKPGKAVTSEASFSPQMKDDLSDEGLISATANGSIVALEAIYDRYHQILYSLAYRMVADHQIAEDMLQDAFVAVWQHAVTYVPKAGSVKTWLCSIIHHRAIDYIRKAQRRSALSSITLDALEQEPYIASPDAWDGAWRHIQGEQVRDALMHLSKEQRLVIVMAYFGGWTHTEIAESCQVPLGTVKARMRLGLNHLRRLLTDKGMDDLS